MSQPTPLNQSQYFGQNVKNVMIPKEGPQAVPITLPFSTGTSFLVDLTLQQIRKYVSIIQCLFIDNSGNTASLLINVSVVNQTISCPPKSQMYIPILVPTNAVLTCTSSGAVDARLDLINVPLPFGIWAADTYVPNFDASGDMLVSDPLAESYLAQIVSNTSGGSSGSADIQGLYDSRNTVDVVTPIFIGSNTMKNINLNVTGAYNILYSGASQENQSMFLTSLAVNVSGDATLATAGVTNLAITCKTPSSSDIIFNWNIALPATGTAIAGNPSHNIITLENLNYIAPFVYNGINPTSITAAISVALTAGTIDIAATAGYTNFHF